MTTLAQDLGGVVRLLEKATFGVLRADGHKDWFQPTVMLHSGDDIVARYHHGAPDFTCTVGKYEYELRNAEAIEACVNFIRTHSDEIAGALRDAERYRWLRAQNAITETPDSWTITRCDFTDEDEPIRYWVGDDLDTAIDSAMQQGGGGE